MKQKSTTCIGIIKQKNGKLIIAGDRRCSNGDGSGFKLPIPKIASKQKGKILIGGSGTSSVCYAITYQFVEPKLTKELASDDYLFYNYIPELKKFLKLHLDWELDSRLVVPSDVSCLFIVSIRDEIYLLEIFGEKDGNGSIGVLRIPAPYVVGCGSPGAYPNLFKEFLDKGYNTRYELQRALEITAEIHDGCDNNIDIIIGD